MNRNLTEKNKDLQKPKHRIIISPPAPIRNNYSPSKPLPPITNSNEPFNQNRSRSEAKLNKSHETKHENDDSLSAIQKTGRSRSISEDSVVGDLQQMLSDALERLEIERTQNKKHQEKYSEKLHKYEKMLVRKDELIHSLEGEIKHLKELQECNGIECKHIEELKSAKAEFELNIVDAKLELVNAIDKLHDVEYRNERLEAVVSGKIKASELEIEIESESESESSSEDEGEMRVSRGSFLSISRMSNAARISNVRAPLDYLFESLIVGSEDFKEVLETCSTESMNRHFMVLCRSLYETLQIFQKRVEASCLLQQQVCFTRSTGSYEIVNLMALEENAESLILFNDFLQAKYEKGYVYKIPANKTIYHPFKSTKITKIIVKEVFLSKMRPILLELHTNNRIPSNHILLKYGSDMRRDVACMSIFRLLNQIWKFERHNQRSIPIEMPTYDCVAFDENFGAVQFIEGCFPIHELDSKSRKVSDTQRNRMIPTAAGSYISSYLLGVADRHHDNILMCKNGSIIHVDFTYLLGETVTMDTAEFAITPGLKDAFGEIGWIEFIARCVEAFVVLRKHYTTIIKFSSMMLGPLYTEKRVQQYIRKTLMMPLPLATAVKKLEEMLKRGPSNYRTLFKNAMHRTVQKMQRDVEL